YRSSPLVGCGHKVRLNHGASWSSATLDCDGVGVSLNLFHECHGRGGFRRYVILLAELILEPLKVHLGVRSRLNLPARADTGCISDRSRLAEQRTVARHGSTLHFLDLTNGRGSPKFRSLREGHQKDSCQEAE